MDSSHSDDVEKEAVRSGVRELNRASDHMGIATVCSFRPSI
jgi:hypothetical protein